MIARPKYCPQPPDDTPEGRLPCPACGATIEGNDLVHGICQAQHPRQAPLLVEVVLVDRRAGEITAYDT